MRYLLDTHAILWFAQGSDELPPSIRVLMGREECCCSVASFWEIAIKQSIGKLRYAQTIPSLARFCEEANFHLLGISPECLEHIKTLPFIHSDPFDRLLIATAQIGDMAIVTCDNVISRYPVRTLW